MQTPETKNPSAKVLLISDNAKDVLTMRMMLADVKAGAFDVALAKSLEEGWAKLADEEVALVLLDLTVKGNKGLEALLELQKRRSDVPVVILTARENQAVAFEAVKQGAQDYLVKGKLDTPLLFRVMRYAIERHRVMDVMKQKNEELRRLNALKSEFVSTVSHELRTPLTVVMSAADNLLDGAFGTMSDSQKKWVEKISHHASRLQEMIDDILDLSKLQSGKTKIRREPVDVAVLVRSSVENLRMLTKDKGISLTCEPNSRI